MSGWRSLLVDDVGRPPVRRVGRPLLCLSDIHGDLVALESVLSAVRSVDLGGIVVAGDHCLGGPKPFAVWQRLQSLGAQLARGPSDLALGALQAVDRTPSSAAEEARILAFLRTRQALGDVVCRRLAELPATLVVSLEDTRGVMVMHGSPVDDCRGLTDDEHLADDVACVAEDALVVGATHVPFARRVAREPPWCEAKGEKEEDEDDAEGGIALPPAPLLVANVGSVGMSPVRRPDGRRTAHAVLVAAGDDGALHAWGQDVLVVDAGNARRVG
jgi:predicted phosphodiesterase